jgi:hypothetical protein
MKDEQETMDVKSPTRDHGSSLGKQGVRSMQGLDVPAEVDGTAVPENSSPTVDETPVSIEALDQPAYDPAKLRYELGSLHKDYQAYKDLLVADRKHELGQQAATADSLSEAIATTLAARKEAQATDETLMDEYFYKKYGRAPYTTDAYPKNEDE